MLSEGGGDLTEGHSVQQQSQTAPCSTYCNLAYLLYLLWQVLDKWRRKHKAETGSCQYLSCPFLGTSGIPYLLLYAGAALLGIIMEHKCRAAAGDLTTVLSGPNLNRATQQNTGKWPVLVLLLLQHLLNCRTGRECPGESIAGWFQVVAELAAAGLSCLPAEGSITLASAETLFLHGFGAKKKAGCSWEKMGELGTGD